MEDHAEEFAEHGIEGVAGSGKDWAHRAASGS